jgi:hypothetical protein
VIELRWVACASNGDMSTPADPLALVHHTKCRLQYRIGLLGHWSEWSTVPLVTSTHQGEQRDA